MILSTTYLVLLLMAARSSFQYCLAEELQLVYPPAVVSKGGGGTTQPADNTNNNALDHQFIIEFERNKLGEGSKRRLFRKAKGVDADLEVLEQTENRNIVIVKFRDSVTAAKWRKNASGIKAFEQGRK